MNKAMLTMFVSASLAAPVAGLAGPFEDAWQQPVNITLPEPTRTIVLRRDVAVDPWLAEHRIDAASILPMGRQHLIQFPATDEQWALHEQGVCKSAQVAHCGTAVCQAIQMEARVDGAGDSTRVKARVVKRADRMPEEGDIEEAETTCRTAMAAVPPPGSEAGVHLNLRELGDIVDALRADRETAGGGDAAGGASDSTKSGRAESQTATQEQGVARSGESAPRQALAQSSQVPFQLNVDQTFAGPLQFTAEDLPADTTQYDLVVGEGCREVRIPLDSLEPAHVPGVVLALVDSSSVNAVAASYNLTVLEQAPLASIGENLVLFGTADNLLATLAMLAMDSRVRGAQKQFIYTTSAQYAVSGKYSDQYAALNYGPESTGALALHAATRGGSQTIAVIDTGVAQDHPELDGRVEGLDFTGQGYAAEAHGTAVAGIIAATANNGAGVYGVAPETRILSMKACEPVEEGGLAARCRSSSLVKAVDAAVQKKVGIINMSLAGPPDPLLARMVAQATGSNVLVIAGAGNGGPAANPAFPAALPDVLAVTAVTPTNRLYREANQGTYVDLAAPGVDIVTAHPDGEYPTSSGTSWAAAHVSGIAALVKDLVPFISARELAGMLEAHARELGEPGKDLKFGNGLVDACRSASAATAEAVACPLAGGGAL